MITNPNARNGLQDIQSQEPKQRWMPPPHRPSDPPSPMCDATDAISQDNEKAKAQYPRSPPTCPKLHRPPEPRNGLQSNPKILLPRQLKQE